MREIKFRGKSIVEPEWAYGYYYKTGRFGMICHDKNTLKTTVNIETVGQYTGIDTENGIEIYEGDIIKGYVYKYDEYGLDCSIIDFKSDVFYEQGRFCVRGSDEETYDLKDLYEDGNNEKIEILGNIYANPELLERAN